MDSYFIDTSAWIEYFEGSIKGEKVNEIINNTDNQIFTNNLIIAEVISKVKRKKGNVESAFKILSSSKKIKEDILTAKEAGLLHAIEKEKNDSFSLVDALIIKTAQNNKLKLLTTDNHFKSFKEAIII